MVTHLERRRPGEAKGMKKALLCDTFIATSMIRQRKKKAH
jgi:hypothetical protein